MVNIENMTFLDFDQIKDKLEEFDEFWNENILKSELESQNSVYIVAKKNQEIVGFAGILVTLDDTQITNIVVRKTDRQNGIGTLLLDKLIEKTKKLNRNAISLEVNENNKVAIHLYENKGFEKVGIRKKYYNGRDNAIIMTKQLK